MSTDKEVEPIILKRGDLRLCVRGSPQKKEALHVSR